MPQPNSLAAIPFLGSGLGYRREIANQIQERREAVDFLEIITDQFTNSHRKLRELGEICEVFPVIPHGIGLSIGSAVPLDRDYLRAIKQVSDCTESPYYSEHLCMTRAPGIDIGHLSPLWFTEEALGRTMRNVVEVQDYLGKPLVLENVTYLFEIPGAGMTQPEFFERLVEATGCGILLDVTNVYINSTNHHFDPVEFLRRMPLEHVVQVHVAGGFWTGDVLVDGHSETVQEDTWQLLAKLTAMVSVKGCILEHDGNFPEEISPLLESVALARKILAGPAVEIAAR